MPTPSLLNLRTLFLVFLFGLSNCSTLTNPYIDANTVSYISGTTKSGKTKKFPCTSFPSMEEALKCAHGLQSAYLTAMGEQAELNAWTGIGLIPLTTFVSAVAINDNHQTKITDFGLGAAGVYGVSNWLSNPQRTMVYSAGLQALQCAIDATDGFNIPSTELSTFANNLTELDTARARLKDAVALTNSWLNLHSDMSSASSINAKNMLSLAEASLVEAATLSDQGYLLRAKFVRAPGKLVGAAKGINSKINSSLTESIQSLATLPGVISGVTDLYNNLKASHGGLTSIGVGAAPSEVAMLDSGRDTIEIRFLSELSARTDTLLSRHSELVQSAMRVSQFMRTYSPEPPTAKLASCGVDTANIFAPLSVQPMTLNFGAADTSPKSVSISGGTGKYVYTANTQALNISQTPVFGSLLTVSIDPDNVAAGSYIIVIQDISGNASNIQVVISETAESE